MGASFGKPCVGTQQKDVSTSTATTANDKLATNELSRIKQLSAAVLLSSAIGPFGSINSFIFLGVDTQLNDDGKTAKLYALLVADKYDKQNKIHPHIISGSNELQKVLAEPLKELLSGLEAITDVEFDINCVSPTTHEKRVKETVYNNTQHPEKCFTFTVTPRNANDILSLLPQVTPLPSRSNKKKSSKENDSNNSTLGMNVDDNASFSPPMKPTNHTTIMKPSNKSKKKKAQKLKESTSTSSGSNIKKIKKRKSNPVAKAPGATVMKKTKVLKSGTAQGEDVERSMAKSKESTTTKKKAKIDEGMKGFELYYKENPRGRIDTVLWGKLSPGKKSYWEDRADKENKRALKSNSMKMTSFFGKKKKSV